jgi:hypothetical protein
MSFLKLLGGGNLTKAKLVRAMKSISKWKELVDIFSMKDIQSRVEAMLDEVADTINSMGGSIKGPAMRVINLRAVG